MGALISGAVGAVLAAVLVVGGVSTFTGSDTSDGQNASPTSVSYADE
jgi:hypothetical protein